MAVAGGTVSRSQFAGQPDTSTVPPGFGFGARALSLTTVQFHNLTF